MRDPIRRVGKLVDLLEVGCADPARFLMPLCRTYTGCDFSARALESARARLRGASTPVELVQADAYRLPFEDGRFSAVFSAHMLYRIERRDAQAAALREMARVLEPGGALVLVTANPRPLLFPARALERMVLDSPLWSLTDRIRPLPLRPYRPMTVGWITERLTEAGLQTSVHLSALPSAELDRKVSERRGIGRLLWRSIAHLDEHHPEVAARLGCFVTIAATRPRARSEAGAAPRTRDDGLLESYSTPAAAPLEAVVQLAPSPSGDGES